MAKTPKRPKPFSVGSIRVHAKRHNFWMKSAQEG